MKKMKLVSFVLSLSLILGILLIPITNNVNAESTKDDKSKQLQKLEKMSEKTKKANENFKVSWDEKKGIPRFISGELSDQNINIVDFLDENRDIFNLDAGEFDIKSTETDELGMTHYRTQQSVDGIPVYGAELIVHTDEHGIVTAMNGQVEPKLEKKNWKNAVKLSNKDAIDIAGDNLSFTPDENTFTAEPTSKLFLYKHEDKWQPVYVVELQFVEPYIGREFFYIDAKKGKVLKSVNRIIHAAETGSGTGVFGDTKTLNTYLSNGLYYLYDTTKPMDGIIKTYDAENTMTPLDDFNPSPGVYVTDDNNVFDSSRQRAAVDAHFYAGVVYDYYLDEHNRNSYDNNGADIISSVHLGDNVENAFWTGTQMVYGDGDGRSTTSLSASLDVVAHELTHAVTERSANLEYELQSGALNESFSDVFGILVEVAYEGSTEWLLGEDIFISQNSAIRSMEDPTLYGQPAHMDEFVIMPNTREGDWGGVHYNSGITNKAFYNIATDIGFQKSGDIYYRALTSYLTQFSQFDDARDVLLQSASDLYGENGVEYTAVADGFSAVGIGDTTTTPNDDTFEPNGTLSNAHPISSGESYISYISSSSDVDYYTFTTGGAGDITVNLTSLPADYDLYLLNSNGVQLEQSINGNTSSESIQYTASGADTFYLQVFGYNGANSTNDYVLSASYPQEQTGGQWFYENVSYDTPHPYPNNHTETYTYTKAGAQQVAIHFSALETESNYDFVHIKDKNGNIVASYDGTQSAFWVTVDGDEISATLETDFSITDYGFTIDQVAYFNDAPLTFGLLDDTKENTALDQIQEADKMNPADYVAPEKGPEKTIEE
ncbi:M4 family metallopeptidase [Chengkuizengella axinellae]|uniref:M4 family metallopeptidase n=1 Tax=Chengkuizengella axinellae TaxID=3064388 RepID=A0ABT9J7V1_9BACL|nr:M4 family metallopeptidase [Chengkuizengella sp. 2205SS18-9]MDP5277034.1 M4 family metallopeptidase [Chengkuizengella sp. 2205SS18-9]